jgi:hypothetical protein
VMTSLKEVITNCLLHLYMRFVEETFMCSLEGWDRCYRNKCGVQKPQKP